MLTPEDRRAIEDLFERLANVECNCGPRDGEAERLIRQRLQDNPAAAYYMAQTIIVQEAALREAHRRVAERERQAQPGQGGFLGGIFGDDRPPLDRSSRRGPWGPVDNHPEPAPRSRAGSGFLAGAAQTALGVTGGMLLGSAIGGMFSGGAQSAEAPAEPDAGAEEPGIDDGGGWGDFDIGGEF